MRIEEIFFSLQGETHFAGIPFLFIRLSGCNLRCSYCDTPAALQHSPLCRIHLPKQEVFLSNPIDLRTLFPYLQPFEGYWLSFTGGEPLIQHEAIESFIQLFPHFRFWMETNGTLYTHLSPLILKKIEVWSMDVKLPSATGIELWDSHHQFFLAIKEAPTIIVKVIFTPTTPLKEMEKLWETFQSWKIQRSDLSLLFQPASHQKNITKGEAFQWAYEKVLKTPDGSIRLLPQIHPTLNIP